MKWKCPACGEIVELVWAFMHIRECATVTAALPDLYVEADAIVRSAR
jgi:hypothetical protein